MEPRLGGVVIEALDVPGLAGFWAQALEWEEHPSDDDGVAVLRSPKPGRVGIAFVPSTRPRTAKSRLHLDLAGGAEEVERLLALGAVRIDIGQGDVPWEVLADPEGNEFCVLPDAEADDHLAAIAQDAADAAVQGRFWRRATGWAVVDRGDWGIRLRDPAGTGPTLVMGPPATPKTDRNRLRLALIGADTSDTADTADTSEAADTSAGVDASAAGGVDPEGNEFERWEPFSRS
ncbi:hypothetical protein ABIA32_005653 [Streptacidiphilus sp. MAP12-20]|uniref:VOC family protein n=1 Tax=Streptacidiphilus sp. MAP12-20 TaxID=3156299 RepID=UPI0035139C9B